MDHYYVYVCVGEKSVDHYCVGLFVQRLKKIIIIFSYVIVQNVFFKMLHPYNLFLSHVLIKDMTSMHCDTQLQLKKYYKMDCEIAIPQPV